MSVVVLIDRGFDFGRGSRIAICETDVTGHVVSMAKPVTLEFEPLQRGSQIVPTFSLDTFQGDDLLRAFAEACNKANIKPPEPHRLEGKLEAMTAHLQDLRTLLKLRTP